MTIINIYLFIFLIEKCSSSEEYYSDRFGDRWVYRENDDEGKTTFVDKYINRPKEDRADAFRLRDIEDNVARKDTIDFSNIDNFFAFTDNDLLESEHGSFHSSDATRRNVHYYTRNNYVYPYKTTTKNKVVEVIPNEGLVYSQIQTVAPNSQSHGYFYSQDSPLSDIRTKDESYALKEMTVRIPTIENMVSTTTRISTLKDKNEETYLSAQHHLEDSNSNSTKQLNNMLRKYIANLIVERYGPRKSQAKQSSRKSGRKDQLHSPSFNRNSSIDTNEPESKFFYSNTLWELKNNTINKIKQLFSLFTVVKFDHTECNATDWSGTWQGICLTSPECTSWNGTVLGNCANGFGACCVFRGSCGDSTSTNCSYFKSPNYPDYYPADGTVVTPTTTVAPTVAPTPDPRLHWYHYSKFGRADFMQGRQSATDAMSCVFNVYKSNPEVQQFRIDFVDLDLAGPTNGTCSSERLVITGQNSNDQIPVICGYNTGQHVYLDVSELNGPLQIMILSSTGASKRFKLKICQFTDSCGSSQNNCLQYYTGVTGIVQSFNYDQAAMFSRSTPGYSNNLNYAICIRREAGYCSITYMNVYDEQTYPFQLLNTLEDGQTTVPDGQAGVDVVNCPDDYVIIDGTRLCGDRFNDGSSTADFSMNAAVTDTNTGPIVLNVRTNGGVTGLGFKLYYVQNPCPET